ncbi:28S ribosomal protein S31, mitochondrial [Fundulus heteroclitus]|uniref:28S ribosomal protein S31, mitochondrial n=1 Tax=Fundulus heteroclitus TaxID=8078 RepID=UPI00165AFDB7|nr:28S ribosomal protein S31, mitochondrial [Fundulus heteroclitus]XP_035999111.1 28S ribosomal protein S31, mitochondrial [Fundulus heteroclitus]XP_035999113.1 28S ribosomal protein S31, mitochondrial [Fundulus heteroclitus]XP_035999114.1 28S ribosomal protein S31, mitochondrial [Fundulus heteroclitus]
MYRFLSRTVCAARNHSLCVSECCVFPAKYDSVSRAFPGVGANTLSTCTVRRCEKKDDAIPAHQDEATNVDPQTKFTQPQEEPAEAKANVGGSTQHQTDVKAEQVKSDGAKRGKESLLDLLGAMKVEVTSKRKLKDLKKQQRFESATQYKSSPAAMESTISMFQRATVEASAQGDSLDPKLVAAASAAAATLPNRSRAESELLTQLKQRKALSEAQRNANSLGLLISDMKIGKTSSRQNAWPADQIRFDDDGQGYVHDRGITSELANVRKRRSIYPEKRLNIFPPTPDEPRGEPALAKPTLWDMDFANQLLLSTNQMPRNGFEEMIQWTKEGKLWQYPINNEIGLEDEASVPFHEHVFLGKHLEEGFPRQGPVRHFMELVVAGLSRNPYLTVQQKKEHISWFRDYFHQKEEVLNEADVYLN